MPDQVYTAALDYANFEAGMKSMEAQTDRFAGAFERGMANIDKAQSLHRFAGNFDRGMDDAIERQKQAQLAHAAAAEKAQGAERGTVDLAAKVFLAGETARKAWRFAADAIDEYAKRSKSAAAEVARVQGAVSDIKASIGRDIMAGGDSGFFTSALKSLNSLREGVVDFHSNWFRLFIGDFSFNNAQQGREAQKRVEEMERQFEVQKRINDAQRQARRDVVAARAASGEDLDVQVAILDAAEKRRQKWEEISAITDISVNQARELMNLAEAEERASVRGAKAARQRRLDEEAAAKAKEAAERAAANEDLARMAQRAALEGWGESSNQSGFALDQVRRRLDYEEKIAEIKRGQASEEAKATAIAFLAAKLHREDREASLKVAKSAADLAVQSNLDALGANAKTKEAAELARRILEDQKALDELKRAGARQNELDAVKAAQEGALAAAALGLSTVDGKKVRAGKLDAGVSSAFASQVFGGGGGRVDDQREQTAAAKELVKQAKLIADRLARLQTSLTDVGGLAP